MENMTIEQKKKHYRKLQIASAIGEYVVVPVPFAIMAIVNREEWFPNPEVGWRVGIGGLLAISLMMFAIFLITKNKERDSENKVEAGYISLMLGWALIAVICTLISSILNQLATIMWVGLSGIAAGLGLDITRQRMKKQYLKQKGAQEEAEHIELVGKASEERQSKKAAKKAAAIEEASKRAVE